jgi:hypothetical protein
MLMTDLSAAARLRSCSACLLDCSLGTISKHARMRNA